MKQTNITPELIRAALTHIPATLPRDEWARVAMAIKSEFPDTTGLDLFTDWSATAEGYDLKATRSTWRSIKAGGGVGIGTLLHLAKEHGFTVPKADHAPAPPSPEVLAQRERDRSATQDAEQARNDAQRKQLYLERIVQASLPDVATEPRRLRGILATLVVGLIAWSILTMLLAGVREHQD